MTLDLLLLCYGEYRFGYNPFTSMPNTANVFHALYGYNSQGTGPKNKGKKQLVITNLFLTS